MTRSTKQSGRQPPLAEFSFRQFGHLDEGNVSNHWVTRHDNSNIGLGKHREARRRGRS